MYTFWSSHVCNNIISVLVPLRVLTLELLMSLPLRLPMFMQKHFYMHMVVRGGNKIYSHDCVQKLTWTYIQWRVSTRDGFNDVFIWHLNSKWLRSQKRCLCNSSTTNILQYWWKNCDSLKGIVIKYIYMPQTDLFLQYDTGLCEIKQGISSGCIVVYCIAIHRHNRSFTLQVIETVYTWESMAIISCHSENSFMMQ